MAGLLDSLVGSRGGLLDALLYPSPLLQKQEMPMPDTMAGFIPPQMPDPFGPTPQLSPVIPPAPVLPPSVFNQGTAGVPGLMSGYLQPSAPQSQVEPQPPTPAIPSQPQSAAPAQAGNINVGGYQMPRIGDAAQYIPQVPTDVSAQSKPQVQTAPQELPPALGGGSPLGRIFNPDGLIARLTGNDSKSIAQQNLSAQYKALTSALMQSGMSPNEARTKAMVAVLNPKAGESIFAQAFGNKEPPKSVEEFAVRQAWENRGRGGGGDSSGLPTTLDALEKYKTDQEAAKRRATTIAEQQAKNAVSLPDTLLRAEETIKQIDEIKNHPAKGYRTGFPSILPAVPGFGGADFDERVKQLKGGAFLDAYKMLRGTGAISEAEGIKAEQAQARLSQAKSEADFNRALDDLREVVVRGYANSQKMAGEQNIKPYEMPVGQSRNVGGVTIRRIN